MLIEEDFNLKLNIYVITAYDPSDKETPYWIQLATLNKEWAEKSLKQFQDVSPEIEFELDEVEDYASMLKLKSEVFLS